MKVACPCCGYLTLTEKAGDEICQICFWHDDGQDVEVLAVQEAAGRRFAQLGRNRRDAFGVIASWW
jgi:hypothetical protein